MRPNGFLGVSGKQVSSANEDILPDSPVNWTNDKYNFYKFSFMNYQACTVKINGGEPMFLPAEFGFETNENDVMIKSFVVVEQGIEYVYVGGY